MKLEVEKDRLEINKIIENCLPLMIKNKNMTQECSDCIILYFIEKIEKSKSKTRKLSTAQNNIKRTKQRINEDNQLPSVKE